MGPVRKPHCWFSHQAAHIEIFSAIKMESFFGKNMIVFNILGQNIDYGYTLEPPR